MKRKRRLRGNGTMGEKKDLKRLKAGEMERTEAMGKRMCEIKKKQSEGRDNMKQQQRARRGRETAEVREEIRGASEVVDGGEQ